MVGRQVDTGMDRVDQDPRQSPEILIYQGLSHRVMRTVDPVHGPLIVKQAWGDADAGRGALDHEIDILQRLLTIPGLPRLVRFDGDGLAVADFGGVTLEQSGRLGRVDLKTFLGIAEALAEQLAALHGRGIIHKDINPTNLLIRPDDWQVQIIDFDLATTFADEHPEFTHPDRVLGTPAYLSPEQTGRMNRPVDYRTDLYSLGATLYALATGTPPFDESDPLALMHAHLARPPQPPQERAPWLHPRVAEVILELLVKEPDERYQSAAGLAHDLGQLRLALAEGRPLALIQLKTRDLPLAPRPPHRLYGRDRELETLLATFDEVTKGGVRGLFVAGYSGVGKTSLIQEIHRSVSVRRGLMIHGKFEQFQPDRPFLAPARSLAQLCQLLLADPWTGVDQWRERILAGLGSDAAALLAVVPELAMLLGPLPPVPELEPIADQLRLRALLVALIRVVAGPDHPLVVFLDDLQWADAPSLQFITDVLGDTELSGLLLIGAYRDQEVEAEHPLLRLLRQPTASGEPPLALTLASLTGADLDTLLAEMLRISPDEARPLASSVFAKTNGNPFFTIELIHRLHDDGVLWPDPRQGRWCWDAEAIAAYPVSANVVDFLAERLAEWAEPVADLLVAAAGLGHAWTLGRLALATGRTAADLARELTKALEQGVLETTHAVRFDRADPEVSVRFAHDRMQQAAYRLRAREQRQQIHLAMARRLALAGEAPDHRFSAAEHYAAAAPLILEPVESERVRELCCDAARQARLAGSYAAAEHFLRLAIDQLTSPDTPADQAWEQQPAAALSLHVELHRVLYCLSRHAESDEVYARLAAHAREPVQLVESAGIQIASLSNRTRYADAVRLACTMLDGLGIGLPQADLTTHLEQEIEAFYRHAADGALERLPESAAMTDERLLGAAALMNRVIPAAFFDQPMLALWVALRALRLAIEQGFCAAILYPASSVIVGTAAFRNDYATGYQAARMALAAGEARAPGIETTRARQQFGLLNSHWFNPLNEDIDHARAAFDGCLRGGDLELGCYTFFTTQPALLDTCAQLETMRAETDAALGFAAKTGNRHAEQSFLSFRQLLRALAGQTSRPGCFDDAEFTETAHQADIARNAMAQAYFHIYRALAAALFDEETSLIRHAEAGMALTPHIACFYPSALAHLLRALALIGQIRATAGATEAARLLETLSLHQTWLAERAAAAPVNFAHLHDLVEAERLDLIEQPWAALQTFEQAMRRARAHQRPWHEALITERAGRFHQRHGQDHAGRALLARAHTLYLRWGAHGKTQAMREGLAVLDTVRVSSLGDQRADALDHEALLRASRALTAETSMERLAERVMALVGQLTGATDAWLLIEKETGAWRLAGGLRGQDRLEPMSLAAATERGIISSGVFQLGLNTRLPIISDDAVIDSRFRDDPHFAGLARCALMALPILLQGRVTAFLALENRLLRAAFTAERIDILSMLCGPMAVSIENLRLRQSIVQNESRALQLATIDRLTGIANRAGFEQRVRELAQACERQELDGFALMILDCDEFKRINHGFGMPAGDSVLKTIAHRLTAIVPEDALVARLEADRFALAVPNLEPVDDARLLAQRLLVALRQPYPIGGTGLRLHASLGMAFFPRDADGEISALLLNADLALVQAKAEGGNEIRVFDRALAAAAEQRRRLENDLRLALPQQELVLFYQPIIDLRENRLAGAEALLRWRHPEHGMVRPDSFIPLAEDIGLINEIGHWILETVGRQIVACRTWGQDLYFSLNVSGRQIPDGLPPALLRETARRLGFPPRSLALEITESVFLGDTDRAKTWLAAVRAEGFLVYLDDFGTGYSSLSYLKHFPVDCMKIDQGFVRDMTEDGNDRALVEAMLAIGKSLDIEVVAEGVETAEQLRLLRRMGFRYAQGYYFARPEPIEVFAGTCARIAELLR